MPQVVVTQGAVEGLEGCRQFLRTKAPDASKRAAQAIARQFKLLETAPEMGRQFREMPELRELLISFGQSGYVALYRYTPNENAVYTLAFRHQKDVGY